MKRHPDSSHYCYMKYGEDPECRAEKQWEVKMRTQG